MATATTPLRTKGSHLIQAQRWVDGHLGPGSFTRLFTESSGAPPGLLLPGTWYDVEPVEAVLAKVGEKLGRSTEDVTVEIARENALHDLTTIYRVFLRLAAPQWVLGQTPRLWSTYVAFGNARAIVNERGRYVGEGGGIPKHLMGWACGAWRGFLPAAIELSGGKQVRGRVVSRGEGTLRYEATYSL